MMAPSSPRRPVRWLVLTGCIALFGIVIGGNVVRRKRHRRILRGELIPVRTPDVPGAELLPVDLGRLGANRFRLGKHGKGQWRLSGWQGDVTLIMGPDGNVRLAVSDTNITQVTVNGQPVFGTMTLNDGDTIGCGDYLVRYENLLQA